MRTLIAIATILSATVQAATLQAANIREACPVTRGVRGAVPPSPRIFGGPVWFGDGRPVYMAILWGEGHRIPLAPIPVSQGMRRAKTAWVAHPSYSGAIEIRGRSLRGDHQRLLFGASGSEPTERLRLTAPHIMLSAGWRGPDGRPLPAPPPTKDEWSFWPAATYIPGPGCFEIQIDTPGRSDTVVFEAVD